VESGSSNEPSSGGSSSHSGWLYGAFFATTRRAIAISGRPGSSARGAAPTRAVVSGSGRRGGAVAEPVGRGGAGAANQIGVAPASTMSSSVTFAAVRSTAVTVTRTVSPGETVGVSAIASIQSPAAERITPSSSRRFAATSGSAASGAMAACARASSGRIAAG